MSDMIKAILSPIGILLAFLLPNCQIVLVENKEESLRRAGERIDQLKLTNVLLYQCNLDYYFRLVI